MGPTRMRLSQAGDRRHRGARRRRRPRARALVRPAGGGRGRRARRVLPPLGRAADRRRHGPAAAADRDQPGAGPDPHRPPGRRRGGRADRAGEPGGPAGHGAGRGRGARRRARRRSRRRACATTGSRCWSRTGWTRPTRSRVEYAHGVRSLAAGRPRRRRSGSPREPAGTAPSVDPERSVGRTSRRLCSRGDLLVLLPVRRRRPAWRRPATSPTRPPPRRRTSPARWRSRCWSRARPGSARPSWPRRWPGRRAPTWSGCSATRGSTRRARCTSGTTRSSCCASRPRRATTRPGRRPTTTSSPTSSC